MNFLLSAELAVCISKMSGHDGVTTLPGYGDSYGNGYGYGDSYCNGDGDGDGYGY